VIGTGFDLFLLFSEKTKERGRPARFMPTLDLRARRPRSNYPKILLRISGF